MRFRTFSQRKDLAYVFMFWLPVYLASPEAVRTYYPPQSLTILSGKCGKEILSSLTFINLNIQAVML